MPWRVPLCDEAPPALPPWDRVSVEATVPFCIAREPLERVEALDESPWLARERDRDAPLLRWFSGRWLEPPLPLECRGCQVMDTFPPSSCGRRGGAGVSGGGGEGLGLCTKLEEAAALTWATLGLAKWKQLYIYQISPGLHIK